jgi:hypothetical protein
VHQCTPSHCPVGQETGSDAPNWACARVVVLATARVWSVRLIWADWGKMQDRLQDAADIDVPMCESDIFPHRTKAPSHRAQLHGLPNDQYGVVWVCRGLKPWQQSTSMVATLSTRAGVSRHPSYVPSLDHGCHHHSRCRHHPFQLHLPPRPLPTRYDCTCHHPRCSNAPFWPHFIDGVCLHT